jgi:hypothetical protein
MGRAQPKQLLADLAGRVRERRLKHAPCEADRERAGRGLVGAMNVRAGFAFGVSACVPLSVRDGAGSVGLTEDA